MAKIAIMLADDFEDSEYLRPTAAFRAAGGDYLDQEVVIDHNLVSSRSPADLPAFIRACLDKLA